MSKRELKALFKTDSNIPKSSHLYPPCEEKIDTEQINALPRWIKKNNAQHKDYFYIVSVKSFPLENYRRQHNIQPLEGYSRKIPLIIRTLLFPRENGSNNDLGDKLRMWMRGERGTEDAKVRASYFRRLYKISKQLPRNKVIVTLRSARNPNLEKHFAFSVYKPKTTTTK
jgi:hypothetical protein